MLQQEAPLVGHSRRDSDGDDDDDGVEGDSVDDPRLPFPYSRCISKGSNSPYLLQGPPPTFSRGVMWINLTVAANPSADTQAQCYKRMLRRLYKLNINTRGW
jgi:hypothetical protein